MKKTIMVCDDEEDIRNTVKTILKKEGYNVVTAKNADDCLKKAEAKKFDLILLDIMMPGTPVKKIIPKLKSKVAFLSVVTTTEAEKEEMLKQKNIVDFIHKPFDVDYLVGRVKKRA
jgi:DNA-binding response OmpR family regulator